MSQFKFDALKILKTKSLYFGLVVLLLLFLLPLLTPSDNERVTQDRIYNLESNIDIQSQNMNRMGGSAETEELNEDREELISLNRELSRAYQDNDSRRIVELELEKDTHIIERSQSGSLDIGSSLAMYKENVAINEYLLEHDIERVDPWHNKVPTANYIYLLFTGLIPMSIVYMIIGLIFASTYTLEKRNNNIDFLNSIPKSLHMIAASKLINISALIFISITVIFSITVLMNSFQYGIGDFNYPVGVSDQQENIHVMEMHSFIFQGLTLIILFILFLSVLSFLISLFTDNLVANGIIILSVVLLSDTGLINEISILESFAHFLPMSYMDAFNVIQKGDMFNPLPNSSTNFTNGLITLSLSSVLMLVISIITIKVKKRL